MGTCCGLGNTTKGTAAERAESARAAKAKNGTAPGSRRRVVRNWKRPYGGTSTDG